MRNIDWKNLILSVGKIHIRKLSPIEVAQTIVKAEDSGFSLKEIANKCLLEGPSILSKFKNLLKIREDYWHLIDWGDEGSLISFTIAQSIGRFDPEVQKLILEAKIKYKLNKDEVSTLNQRIDRSGKTVEECINEAANKKQKTIINMFIGALFPETVERLKDILQFDKDRMLQTYINEMYPGSRIIAKVGKIEFTLLVHDGNVFLKISSEASPLEKKVNEFLQIKTNDSNK